MTFQEAFTHVIGHEGGYIHDPRDPGGETKYGISKRAYPDLDIAALTLADAELIYRRDYWDPIHGDELPGEVALHVFDYAVNSGVRAAIRALQKALKVTPDGMWGPKTAEALWRSADTPSAEALVFSLTADRLEHMVAAPNWSDASRGWIRRVAANLRQAGGGRT